MGKKRIPIPIQLRRELLVECGHKCSIHNCTEKQGLEAHHINSNPSDNRKDNLLMLCPNHHDMVGRRMIDRKSCRMYKQQLQSTQITAEQILEVYSRDTKQFVKSELDKIAQRIVQSSHTNESERGVVDTR